MKKVLLNDCDTIDRVYDALKRAVSKHKPCSFKLQCDNCILSFLIESYSNINDELIEVELRNTDDSNTAIKSKINGHLHNYITIYTLPLVAFPVFAKQFRHLEEKDFAEVWKAWETISDYMYR
jgi:hypothetical protein